jgi:hypothetical protein
VQLRRHFHFGPNPPVDSGMDVGPASVELLYKNALQSIFKFLRLPELHSAISVCKSWKAAVISTKCIPPFLPRQLRRSTLLAISASGLARHIPSIVVNFMSVEERLNQEEMSIIAENMPHLRKLLCNVQLSSPLARVVFPKYLDEMSVYFSLPHVFSAADVASINAAIVSIASLAQLRVLSITLPGMHEGISLEPLSHMHCLRDLSVRKEGPMGFCEVHVDQLRKLAQLEVLGFISTVDRYARLLAPPHQLQLQELDADFSWSDEFVTLLPLIPSLMKLWCAELACRDFSFLGGLPNLTSISLNLNVREAPQPTAEIVAGLSLKSLGSVTEVSLFGGELCCADLTCILSGKHALLKLELMDFTQLESLAFLAEVPSLAVSLGEFSCMDCMHAQLSPTDLRYLLQLKALRTLEIVRSFNCALDPFTRAHFTPVSHGQLPALKEFKYFRS